MSTKSFFVVQGFGDAAALFALFEQRGSHTHSRRASSAAAVSVATAVTTEDSVVHHLPSRYVDARQVFGVIITMFEAELEEKADLLFEVIKHTRHNYDPSSERVLEEKDVRANHACGGVLDSVSQFLNLESRLVAHQVWR